MDTYSTIHDLLLTLSVRCNGDSRAVYQEVRLGHYPNDEEIEDAKKRIKSKVFTYQDSIYPHELERIYPTPLTLFYRGNISLIHNPNACVAIVGARVAHTYALEKTRKLAATLAKAGFTIVSGLARGIDSAALEAALPYGKAVAVIGNGMDYYYPPENEELQKAIAQNGLLISEYPDYVAPQPIQFVARNRIIAGITQVLVVAEARRKSGSLITAAFASTLGHDVCAFPHEDDGDSGCNMIIKDGAFLIEDETDIYDILGTKADPILGRKKEGNLYK